MGMDARVRYDVFGTSATPKALTGSFVADSAVASIVLTDGFREFLLNISFTAGSTAETCEVQIETSNDKSNWFVWSENNYPDASPATKLGIAGTPYETPQDTTTSAASVYNRSYDFRLQSKYLRFKVKSTAGSGFGTAWVELWGSER